MSSRRPPSRRSRRAHRAVVRGCDEPRRSCDARSEARQHSPVGHGRAEVRFVDVAPQQSARIDVRTGSRPTILGEDIQNALARRPARYVTNPSPEPAVIPLGNSLLDPRSARQRPEHGLGRPRSVTRSTSPRSARSRYSDSRCFSSRTPTSGMWTQSYGKRVYKEIPTQPNARGAPTSCSAIASHSGGLSAMPTSATRLQRAARRTGAARRS